ncbi:MAG: hypothetical protein J6X67_02075, partial [Treponema sp.]|nr:hypothetical protein [Treponema sp.]
IFLDDPLFCSTILFPLLCDRPSLCATALPGFRHPAPLPLRANGFAAPPRRRRLIALKKSLHGFFSGSEIFTENLQVAKPPIPGLYIFYQVQKKCVIAVRNIFCAKNR